MTRLCLRVAPGPDGQPDFGAITDLSLVQDDHPLGRDSQGYWHLGPPAHLGHPGDLTVTRRDHDGDGEELS